MRWDLGDIRTRLGQQRIAGLANPIKAAEDLPGLRSDVGDMQFETSLLMAIDPVLVRPAQMPATAGEAKAAGVSGDPRAASAALGQLGVDLIVTETVAAIRKAKAAPR